MRIDSPLLDNTSGTAILSTSRSRSGWKAICTALDGLDSEPLLCHLEPPCLDGLAVLTVKIGMLGLES